MIGLIYKGGTGIGRGLASFYGSDGIITEVNCVKVLRVDTRLKLESYAKIKKDVEDVTEFYILGVDLRESNKHLKSVVSNKPHTYLESREILNRSPQGEDYGRLRQCRSSYRLGAVSAIMQIITSKTNIENQSRKTNIFIE